MRDFAAAMRRGEWRVTHQGIAFDTTGVLVDGQHRLAAIVEADIPVEVTVFTEVPERAFDLLDTGKRRNAAAVLAIEGEKSAVMLAAMVRTCSPPSPAGRPATKPDWSSPLRPGEVGRPYRTTTIDGGCYRASPIGGTGG